MQNAHITEGEISSIVPIRSNFLDDPEDVVDPPPSYENIELLIPRPTAHALRLGQAVAQSDQVDLAPRAPKRCLRNALLVSLVVILCLVTIALLTSLGFHIRGHYRPCSCS